MFTSQDLNDTIVALTGAPSELPALGATGASLVAHGFRVELHISFYREGRPYTDADFAHCAGFHVARWPEDEGPLLGLIGAAALYKDKPEAILVVGPVSLKALAELLRAPPHQGQVLCLEAEALGTTLVPRGPFAVRSGTAAQLIAGPIERPWTSTEHYQALHWGREAMALALERLGTRVDLVGSLEGGLPRPVAPKGALGSLGLHFLDWTQYWAIVGQIDLAHILRAPYVERLWFPWTVVGRGLGTARQSGAFFDDSLSAVQITTRQALTGVESPKMTGLAEFWPFGIYGRPATAIVPYMTRQVTSFAHVPRIHFEANFTPAELPPKVIFMCHHRHALRGPRTNQTDMSLLFWLSSMYPDYSVLTGFDFSLHNTNALWVATIIRLYAWAYNSKYTRRGFTDGDNYWTVAQTIKKALDSRERHAIMCFPEYSGQRFSGDRDMCPRDGIFAASLRYNVPLIDLTYVEQSAVCDSIIIRATLVKPADFVGPPSGASGASGEASFDSGPDGNRQGSQDGPEAYTAWRTRNARRIFRYVDAYRALRDTVLDGLEGPTDGSFAEDALATCSAKEDLVIYKNTHAKTDRCWLFANERRFTAGAPSGP